jgi:dipeptidase
MVPDRRITVEDVKYILSSHYQGTPYDPYSSVGDASMRGAYRCIGVNRTDFLALLQLRPYVPAQICAVEWLAFGSNVFNAFVPFYTNTDTVPDFLAHTEEEVSTDSFYWTSRMIAALADAGYPTCKIHIERYQAAVFAKAHEILKRTDRLITEENGQETEKRIREANEDLAAMVRRESADVLGKVLYETSNRMRNCYARSDA